MLLRLRLALPALAFMLASCGGTPTATPTAIASHPKLAVATGTSACSFGSGTGIDQIRDIDTKCTVTSSDRRLAGTTEEKSNLNGWQRDGPWAVQWGDATLRNEWGMWTGRFTGFYTPETSDIIAFWYAGSGGYAGLSVYLVMSEPRSGNIWPWRAAIFPGASPSIARAEAPPVPSTSGPIDASKLAFVTGTPDCSFVLGATTYSDGAEHGRDGRIKCTVATSDSRVSGSLDEQWFFDHWSQQDGDWRVQWGDATLKNDTGTWLGRYSGMTIPHTGVINMAWYTGTGGYEGLSYVNIATQPQPPTGFVSLRGMIFPGTPPTG